MHRKIQVTSKIIDVHSEYNCKREDIRARNPISLINGRNRKNNLTSMKLFVYRVKF